MRLPKVQCDWIDTSWLCATQCEEQKRIKAIKKYVKHLEKENGEFKKVIKQLQKSKDLSIKDSVK